MVVDNKKNSPICCVASTEFKKKSEHAYELRKKKTNPSAPKQCPASHTKRYIVNYVVKNLLINTRTRRRKLAAFIKKKKMKCIQTRKIKIKSSYVNLKPPMAFGVCVCVCSVLKIVYYNRSSDQNIFGADTTKSIVVYVHTNKYINIYKTIYKYTHARSPRRRRICFVKEKKCFFNVFFLLK